MDFDQILAIIPESLLDTRLPDPGALKYYEDLLNRIFWINDEINSDLVYELTHYIIKFNKEDKDIPEMDRKPIYLMFDSPGGNIDA